MLTVNSVNPGCSSALFIFSNFSVSYSKITNLKFARTKDNTTAIKPVLFYFEQII